MTGKHTLVPADLFYSMMLPSFGSQYTYLWVKAFGHDTRL